jgi:hypothetical protein
MILVHLSFAVSQEAPLFGIELWERFCFADALEVSVSLNTYYFELIIFKFVGVDVNL